MTYNDFLFNIVEIQNKLISITKNLYSTLSSNYIFKTIISMLLFSIIMWVFFWIFKLVIKIISYKFYKEAVDKVKESEEHRLLESWKNIQSRQASEEEIEEMRDLLSEFYNDSHEMNESYDEENYEYRTDDEF